LGQYPFFGEAVTFKVGEKVVTNHLWHEKATILGITSGGMVKTNQYEDYFNINDLKKFDSVNSYTVHSILTGSTSFQVGNVIVYSRGAKTRKGVIADISSSGLVEVHQSSALLDINRLESPIGNKTNMKMDQKYSSRQLTSTAELFIDGKYFLAENGKDRVDSFRLIERRKKAMKRADQICIYYENSKGALSYTLDINSPYTGDFLTINKKNNLETNYYDESRVWGIPPVGFGSIECRLD
jgi:hypothetical protein